MRGETIPVLVLSCMKHCADGLLYSRRTDSPHTMLLDYCDATDSRDVFLSSVIAEASC